MATSRSRACWQDISYIVRTTFFPEHAFGRTGAAKLCNVESKLMIAAWLFVLSCMPHCSNPCYELNGLAADECGDCAIEVVGRRGCGPHSTDFPEVPLPTGDSPVAWRVDPITRRPVAASDTCGVRPKVIRYISNFGKSRRAAHRLWSETYATSTPAVLKGIAADAANEMRSWSKGDLDERWGGMEVEVSYAPAEYGSLRRPVRERSGKTYLMGAARVPQNLSTFLRAERHPNETAAIQQSPMHSEGDPVLAIPHSIRRIVTPGLASKNLWVSNQTLRTTLHFDKDDGFLLQLVGRKHVTLVDPDTLDVVAPKVLELLNWVRISPGNFTTKGTGAAQPNFPLRDLSNPSVFGKARVHTLWLKEGDGLILPSTWSHDVRTYVSTQGYNVALNFWFKASAYL